jgi:hypothetical protein
MQQMVGQNWLSVAAFNFTHAAGWLAGRLAAVADSRKAGRIIFCCRVVADLIYEDTRFRVFFFPPCPLSLSLSFSLFPTCSWLSIQLR